MSAPVDPTFETDAFEPVPAGTEPPEGDVELALQEDALASAAVTPTADPPPVVGRTYAIDFEARRLLPVGEVPRIISGDAARRQAIEKCLRTERGSAAVHSDEYGLEGAEDLAHGQAFDSSEFAELEERVRDALTAMPWVLDVTDFEAEQDPLDGSRALVDFRVVPDGDADQLQFSDFPLPIP